MLDKGAKYSGEVLERRYRMVLRAACGAEFTLALAVTRYACRHKYIPNNDALR